MANVIKIPTRTTFGLSRPTIKIFGTSGYYSPPRDCVVRVHLIGGGGGGANGGYGSTYYGAGGGYVQKTLRLKGGVSYNVTIGAGGTAGQETSTHPYSPYADLFGTAGGNTSFTNYDIEPIIAYGGGGSSRIQSGPQFSPGAIGGTGAGGDVILQGGHGTARGVAATSGKVFYDLLSPVFSAITPTSVAQQDPLSGTGQHFSTNQPPSYTPQRGGFGFGGGGGTQYQNPWQPSVTYKGGGGAGGLGLVIIEEY